MVSSEGVLVRVSMVSGEGVLVRVRWWKCLWYIRVLPLPAAFGASLETLTKLTCSAVAVTKLAEG